MGDVSKSKLKYERQVFSSTHSGDFKVVEYVNAHKVVVEFLFTGEKVIAQMRDILEGRVKDRMYPSVYGVGITGEKIPVAEGKRCKQRELWVRMLDRCYSEKYRLKSPSYVGCTVSDSFKVRLAPDNNQRTEKGGQDKTQTPVSPPSLPVAAK